MTTKVEPTVEKWERELDRMVYPLGGGEMKPVETSPGVLQFKKPPIPKNYPIKDLFRHSLQQAREERDREWRERIEGMKKSRPPVKVRLTSEISDWLNDGYQLALSDLLTKDKK